MFKALPERARRLGPLVACVAVLAVLFTGCTPGTAQKLQSPPADDSRPPVILISIDGFRWDYLDRHEAPALAGLAAEGLRAERLTPVFPSKTFPNHYSMVTGLYPENHGIISNSIVDSTIEGRFSLSNREAIADPRWWGGEPVWATAERQGVRAATFFWPGSEAPIAGIRPTYWKEYDGRIAGEDRVDQVLDWLDLPTDERPAFITLYFSNVDTQGHRHGPDSQQVREAVSLADAHLERLLRGLRDRDLADRVNLMVVSDHGMAATSPERVVLVDDYLDLETVDVIDMSPIFTAFPNDGDVDRIVAALRQAPHLTVYRREEMPERYHFRNSPRIPPVIALAEEGWVITTRSRFEEDPSRYEGGTHGYDNHLPSMGGIFIAHGPAFPSGAVVEPFENIHLYHLLCHLLGIEPAPNDGDAALARMLTNVSSR